MLLIMRFKYVKFLESKPVHVYCFEWSLIEPFNSLDLWASCTKCLLWVQGERCCPEILPIMDKVTQNIHQNIVLRDPTLFMEDT